jgi:hypothetical protein
MSSTTNGNTNILINDTKEIKVTNDNNDAQKHGWSELCMFLCTYRGTLSGLNQKFDSDLAQKLEPRRPIIAINSNFAHKCLPGYESYLKSKDKKKKKKKKKNNGKKERKHQGDGTCFAHAVVFNVELNDTVYNVRCFTASGDTQIPGVVCSDFSDGKTVLRIVAGFLNETKLFKSEIVPINEVLTMRNYSFAMSEASPTLLIKAKHIAQYFGEVEAEKKYQIAQQNGEINRVNQSQLGQYGTYIDPGNLVVKQVKYSNDDNKLSITFEIRNAPASVKSKLLLRIFPHGKMNILGVKPIGGGIELYDYIKKVFNANWDKFIMIKPKPTKKK